MESGQISAEMLKRALMEKYGVDIESDPSLAAHFNNILNVFKDSPEESSSGNKTPSLRSRKGKHEITRILQTPTLIINDNDNDAWNWRKYGSKSIKGSPYQRDYYRCRYGDCKAKIQVQQIQKDPNSPLLYQTTHFNRHTCQAANNNVDTYGSTSMIKFDTQVSSVTSDWDLPPLVTADHQEGIIHNTIWNDDHDSWLNPIIPFDDIKHMDDSWFDFTIPFNDMKDEDESWLNPTISLNEMIDDNVNNMNDEGGSSLNSSVLVNGMDDDDDDDDDDGGGGGGDDDHYV